MNEKIIENLNNEISSLMDKHFHLEKSVDKLQKDLSTDNIEVEKVKKQKLKIKDELIEKQNILNSLLNKS